MTRPLILVTCWRRYLPSFLGGRTLLDTLDPAPGGVIEARGRAAGPTLAAAGSGPA